MANFKLKRRPDFPSGLEDAEMTLAAHIASAAPHPNWTPSGSGSSGGNLDNYALKSHNHDNLYLKLSQVGLDLGPSLLTNIFALANHQHQGYSLEGHDHDSRYVLAGDNSSSSTRSNGSGSSSDGLIIPTPYHNTTYTDSNGNKLPVASGLVDANRLITNGRYIIDAAQSEMTYSTNGAPFGVLQITLQNLNNVSFGVLVTRLTSDCYRTSSAGTSGSNNIQETSLPRVWNIIQTLYSKDSIYTRFGRASISSNGINYPTSPNSTEYKASKDGLYYASMVKTFIATSSSGNSNVGSIQATKTVVYNVLPAYDPYTEDPDIHPVEISRDPTTNEIVAPPSPPNIWNTTPESTSEEYEVITYVFDTWKSLVPTGDLDLTRDPGEPTYVPANTSSTVSSYDYTVKHTGYVLISADVPTGCITFKLQRGGSTGLRLPVAAAMSDSDRNYDYTTFRVQKDDVIIIEAWKDGSWSSSSSRNVNSNDNIKIYEYAD